MANHSLPSLTSLYADFVAELNARMDDLAFRLDPAYTTPTNLEIGSRRWNSTLRTEEKWNGTAWEAGSDYYVFNVTATPAVEVNRTNSSSNAVIKLTTTAGSMYIGNSNGTAFVIDDDSDLSAGPLFRLNNDGSTTISASSASAGLTITQTGAGNALVVEDATSPDSTPFVIDSSGNTVIGHSSALTGASGIPSFQTVGGTTGDFNTIGRFRFSANSGGLAYETYKSRNATVGSHTAVASGDDLAQFRFFGSDGTAFVQAAEILAEVDGTPATGSMPGRILFSTTPSGSSTPVERLRIDNNGSVGIGTSSLTGYTLRLGANITGATTARAVSSQQQIQSDVTATFVGFECYASTQAAAFTLVEYRQFSASGLSSLGAGSAITNNFGFWAGAGNTQATNNYGFYGNLPDSAGRWNFYAAGTAPNYFAGNTGFGISSPEVPIHISAGGHIERNDATANGANIVFKKSRGSFSSKVVPNSDDEIGYFSFQSWNGSSYSNVAQIKVSAEGVQSLTSTPGRVSISTTPSGSTSAVEAIRIDSAQQVGVGSVPVTGRTFSIGKNTTGGVNGIAVALVPTTLSDVTTASYGVFTALATQAASFTLGSMQHFAATQGTFGAGSSVTNQYGFHATSNLTGATNNYGFFANIAAAANRWNFYANGTAPNYFAGQTLIGNSNSTDASVNLLVSSASGSATPTPTELRIQTTTSASDWSTTLPWGRLSFYSADSSALGDKVQAAIDVISMSTAGAASRMQFKTIDWNGTNLLTSRVEIDAPFGSSARLILQNNTGLEIARSSVTSPVASDGNVFSGTYTPTLTNGANVSSSTAYACQYMRIGNTVTVSGYVDISATAANTDTILGLSLPIASAMTSTVQVGGSGACATAGRYGVGVAIVADSTNDIAQFRLRPTATGASAYSFTFTYRVL